MLSFLTQLGNWLQRAGRWFFITPSRAWVAILALPASLLLARLLIAGLGAPDNWEPRIRIAGMLLELGGVGTVAFGLHETRVLFKQKSFAALIAEWWDEKPSWRRNVSIIAGTAHLNFGGGLGTLHGTSSLGPDPTIEDRVAMLERKADVAESAIHRLDVRLDAEAQKHKVALEVERSERQAADEENRKLIERAKTGGLHWETIGALWLFVGITMATISKEIADKL